MSSVPTIACQTWAPGQTLSVTGTKSHPPSSMWSGINLIKQLSIVTHFLLKGLHVWMKTKCSDDQMRPSSNGRRRGVELTGSGDMIMCPHGHLVLALPVLTCHIPQKTRIIRSDASWATGLIIFWPLGYLWGSKRNSWYSGNINLPSGKDKYILIAEHKVLWKFLF